MPGERGPKGDHGQTGDAGGAGVRGSTGDTGGTGDTGERGPHGDAGERGPRGDTGERGQSGKTGEPGKFAARGVHLSFVTLIIVATLVVMWVSYQQFQLRSYGRDSRALIRQGTEARINQDRLFRESGAQLCRALNELRRDLYVTSIDLGVPAATAHRFLPTGKCG